MKKMSIIDDIKSEYKDIDTYPKERISVINLMNFARFQIRISSYKLEQKMADINKIIKDGKIKDTKLIEQCTKQLMI